MGATTTRRIRPPQEAWMQLHSPAKLRRARKNAHLTQEDLASLARVSQQYISLMETGVDTDVSSDVAEKICRHLRLDLEDLFTEKPLFRTPLVASRSRDGRKAVA